MADFPENLPGPILQGYGGSLFQPFIRTQFTTGLARQRRTYSNVPTFQSAQWILTSGEVRIFEAWFRSINDGTEWFDIPLTFATGTSKRTCRFTEVYNAPQPYGSSRNWSITMALELRERPTFTGDDYLYDPLGIQYADVFDKVVNSYLEA